MYSFLVASESEEDRLAAEALALIEAPSLVGNRHQFALTTRPLRPQVWDVDYQAISVG